MNARSTGGPSNALSAGFDGLAGLAAGVQADRSVCRTSPTTIRGAGSPLMVTAGREGRLGAVAVDGYGAGAAQAAVEQR